MTEQNKSRAFLGFGGNIGQPLNAFRHARQQLAEKSKITVISSSPLYQTPPIGGPAGQPDYLNGVVEIRTGLSALNLLQLCHRIEDEAGRIRDQHWGARTLDIDLLLVDDLIMDVPNLTLPHPRLQQRHFVLLPLNDLAPQLNHPVLNTTIGNLLKALPVATGITRLSEIW
ncbi:MAG: 2-amino-4-hydroxy-6-hydroxymethyldihydropteridine diphosphokinase [Thermodesulfobacteriota bacterium]|nr:2-amino-4-hydroxy-6-hydroxymethyldihydropteridine diphosphokinase [Thermodesulfobacteriota bacterium]